MVEDAVGVGLEILVQFLMSLLLASFLQDRVPLFTAGCCFYVTHFLILLIDGSLNLLIQILLRIGHFLCLLVNNLSVQVKQVCFTRFGQVGLTTNLFQLDFLLNRYLNLRCEWWLLFLRR